MLAKRIQKIKESGIREILSVAEKNQNAINLSIGQPDFDVPDEIKKVAIQAIKAGFNKYVPTQGLLELRQKIAQKLQKKNQIKATADQILITSGVSGGIFLAFATLLNPGDEIIILDPYFIMYKQLAYLFGAVPRFIDTYPNFQLDINKIIDAISNKTKLIIINSPNNPTGAVYSEKTLRTIAQIAKKHGLLIISDEIYEDFIYEGKHFSTGSVYDKTLTLNGFSKSYAITGWRIGYASGPKEIIQAMTKLQQFTFVCAPSFAQKAAIKALDFDNSLYIEQYKQKRDLICNKLKKYFDFQKPQGAFYLFPEAPCKNATKFIKKLIKAGVFVVPGRVFSERDTHFRISYVLSHNKLLKGIIKLIKSI